MLGSGVAVFTVVGRDFFPVIDAGRLQLHVRGPAGMRIEATEGLFQAVENKIREIIPARDLDLIVDNIGLPARPYNLAFSDGSTIGVNDGTVQVALKEGHAPTDEYVRRLRRELPAAFPEALFYFQPADMVTQILNFGPPAQINVRTVGYDRINNLRVAREIQRRLSTIQGVVDVTPSAGDRCAVLPCPNRPHARSGTRAERRHHRQQHQCQPEFFRAGHAELLD